MSVIPFPTEYDPAEMQESPLEASLLDAARSMNRLIEILTDITTR